MAKVKIHYKKDKLVTISNSFGMLQVTSSSWRAKRWAKKRLRKELKELGIEVINKNTTLYVGYKNSEIIEESLFPNIINSNQS